MKRMMLGCSLIVALMVGLMMSAAQPVAAQGGDEGSLVIYAFACPDGYDGEGGSDDDVCRDAPLTGAGFSAFADGQDNGIGATSDTDGVATIAIGPIGGGAVNVNVNPPGGYQSDHVACSEDVDATETGIAFAELATDAFVTCQWYFVPAGSSDPIDQPDGAEDGSLTIQLLGCPDADADAADCEASPLAGVAISVAATGQNNGVGAETDANGIAVFPLFAADLPGGVDIKTILPDDFTSFSAYCTDDAGNELDVTATSTGISLSDLSSGAEIGCTFYAQPVAADGGDDRDDVGTLPNTGVGSGADTSTSIARLMWVTLLGLGAWGLGLRLWVWLR